MTGPEHYLEAERLLHHANVKASNLSMDDFRSYVAEAQVHATLALATQDVVEEARLVFLRRAGSGRSRDE